MIYNYPLDYEDDFEMISENEDEKETDGDVEVHDYRQHPYKDPALDNEQIEQVNEQLNLMTRKGVYPYEYMDSWVKFDEIALPTKDLFYSTLTGEDISDVDYEHAKNVFSNFEMQDLRDYHNFYLLTDVLLLADVFESFRNTCISNYDLDPAHCYTAPGLSWQAALKMTGITLDLLTDIDMHLFIEAGIRGGVAVISHRHGQANLPDLPNYDSSKPKQHLVYWDANNLYGWAMSQYLPTGDFKWLTEEEIDGLDLLAIADDSQYGYIYECDLEYPQELHDTHSDYPLAPERISVSPNMLSSKQMDILECYERQSMMKNKYRFYRTNQTNS